MLYSAHQSIPGASKGFGTSTYNGKSFDESGAQPSDLSDAQRKFLTEDNVVMYWLRECKARKWRLAGIIMRKL